ncbi:MAG TPA: NAD-dependent epimerase/dehydratase family protein, partial [Candidatus Acidoferrum sp.]|nr:NAD-dependent epimerase/dehydratase family protein [Candidatus Acidoferrum sp.]
MKVVIAGGSGLIGSAICRALLARGDEPVVLTRHPHRTDQMPAAVREVLWDPPAPGDWVTELAGADVVINLAGASIGHWPWTSRRKALLLESRVTPTRALVEAIAALPTDQRPGVLLSASGTDLYEGRDAV